jgi:hypothetical protein
VTAVIRLLSSPDDVARALVSAAEWSTEVDLCTPAVDSGFGRWPLWGGLLQNERRLQHAFVALDGLRSEPHAHPTAPGAARPNISCRRAGARARDPATLTCKRSAQMI